MHQSFQEDAQAWALSSALCSYFSLNVYNCNPLGDISSQQSLTFFRVILILDTQSPLKYLSTFLLTSNPRTMLATSAPHPGPQE